MIGVGAGTPTDLRRAGATLARRTTNADAVASSLSAVGDDDVLAAFVEGATLGSFGFSMRKDGPRDRPVGRIAIALTANGDERSAWLRRAVATAGASWQARLLASVPSNIKTPAVARRAGRHRRRGRRPEDHRARRAAARRAWLRRRRRRRPGCGRAAAVRADRLPAREGRPQGQARGAGRQGHHLRQRRSLHQARPVDGHHEARHDRCRRRRRGDGGAARRRLPGPGHRTAADRRERRQRHLDASRRRDHAVRRPHHRGHQHRRRGPTRARRRSGVRRGQARPRRPRRHRHAHRSDEGGAGPAHRWPVRQRRRPRAATSTSPAPAPASRCGGCR